jgi:hypothetical protein
MEGGFLAIGYGIAAKGTLTSHILNRDVTRMRICGSFFLTKDKKLGCTRKH